MEKYLEILEKCPLFYGIGRDVLPKMLHCLGARVDFFDKKYTVMAEGNRARYIGIVLSGGLHVSAVDYDGNRIILSEVQPSQTFCEAFAASEVSELPFSVIADEPSFVMFIECSHILHTCSNSCGFHHQLIFNLMKDIATQNIALHQRIEITSGKTTREKLLKYLNVQSRRLGSNFFVIPFDRQELADYLGVDRSGLSNEISKLRDEGLIKCERNRFELIV